MTPLTTAALGAIAFGFAAAFFLLPLAVVIPRRLYEQWRAEMQVHGANKSHQPVVDHAYTAKQRSLFVVSAMCLGAFVLWRYGSEAQGLGYAFYFLCLLLLVAINLKHILLPDIVVLACLWAGLLFQAWSGNAAASVYGAAAGYLIPFAIGLAIRMIAAKDMIGQGDIKTLSMAGAWFGIAAIPTLLAAFIAGVIAWGIAVKLLGKQPQSFVVSGPAHLIASIVVAYGVNVW